MSVYTISSSTPILTDTTIQDEEVIIEAEAVVKARISYSDPTVSVSVQGLFKEYGFGNEYVNAYSTVLEASQYLNLIFDDWEAIDDDQKLKHLLSGTRYIERNFNFEGVKLVSNQSLAFPRMRRDYQQRDYQQVVKQVVIPEQVKKACMEAAYLDFKEDLNPLNTISEESEKDIVELKEKVGPLETVTKYNRDKSIIRGGDKGTASYNAIKGLLGNLLYVQRGVTQLKVDSGL